MIVRDVWGLINERSPFSSACDWDNVGLLVGDMEWRVNRVLLALDATDAVIDHASVTIIDTIDLYPFMQGSTYYGAGCRIHSRAVAARSHYGNCFFNHANISPI